MSDYVTPHEKAVEQAVAAGRWYMQNRQFADRVNALVDAIQASEPDDGFDRFNRQSLIMGASAAFVASEGFTPTPTASRAARQASAKRILALRRRLEVERDAERVGVVLDHQTAALIVSVQALHPEKNGICTTCTTDGRPQQWPCATARTLLDAGRKR